MTVLKGPAYYLLVEIPWRLGISLRETLRLLSEGAATPHAIGIGTYPSATPVPVINAPEVMRVLFENADTSFTTTLEVNVEHGVIAGMVESGQVQLGQLVIPATPPRDEYSKLREAMQLARSTRSLPAPNHTHVRMPLSALTYENDVWAIGGEPLHGSYQRLLNAATALVNRHAINEFKNSTLEHQIGGKVSKILESDSRHGDFLRTNVFEKGPRRTWCFRSEAIVYLERLKRLKLS